MTLDEAIKHAEEAAKKQENNAKSYPRPDRSVRGSGKKYNAYIKSAEEHRQLAEWLKELKQLREQEPVLDKIRAEIDSALSAEVCSDNRQQISDVGVGLEIALSIIDKYKAEGSEE